MNDVNVQFKIEELVGDELDEYNISIIDTYSKLSYSISQEHEVIIPMKSGVNSDHLFLEIQRNSSFSDEIGPLNFVYTDQSNINIINKQESHVSLRLININGQLIISDYLLTPGKNQISRPWQKGVYLVELRSAQRKEVHKIIIK